jgi:hypothetical protein
MLKRVLAIAVIGAAALTSVGACASDYGTSASWSTSRPGYGYAPPVVRYAYPPRYAAPRYAPAYRWAPPAYRWAPPAYYRYGYHPNYRHYWDGHRWSDRNDRRDNDHDDRHRDDDHNWRGR